MHSEEGRRRLLRPLALLLARPPASAPVARAGVGPPALGRLAWEQIGWRLFHSGRWRSTSRASSSPGPSSSRTTAGRRGTARTTTTPRESNGSDFPESLLGPWAKLEVYAARLALILAVLRHASQKQVDMTKLPTVEAADSTRRVAADRLLQEPSSEGPVVPGEHQLDVPARVRPSGAQLAPSSPGRGPDIAPGLTKVYSPSDGLRPCRLRGRHPMAHRPGTSFGPGRIKRIRTVVKVGKSRHLCGRLVPNTPREVISTDSDD